MKRTVCLEEQHTCQSLPGKSGILLYVDLLFLPFRRQFLHETNHLSNQDIQTPLVLMKWSCPEYERKNLPRLHVNVLLENLKAELSQG